jgi:large subunit ribosomal protein L2
MAVKLHNPTTPGQRGMTTQDFSEVTAKKPIRSLISVKRTARGRNNQGRITTRHKGGGVKRFYRQINFGLHDEYVGTIEEIEYDPNRSARIARLKSEAGEFSYVLAAKHMRKGQQIKGSGSKVVENGNRLTLKDIPLGTSIYAVELQPGKGAQLARSAGTTIQLVAKEGAYAQLKLPSGEVRNVLLECQAQIGTVGNEQHQNVKIGKAGRNRKKGIRPTVRGVVMNAADHPHGGGDGGRHKMARPPVTPWGQKTLGFKTRRRKSTTKYIVKSRHQGKRR